MTFRHREAGLLHELIETIQAHYRNVPWQICRKQCSASDSFPELAIWPQVPSLKSSRRGNDAEVGIS